MLPLSGGHTAKTNRGCCKHSKISVWKPSWSHYGTPQTTGSSRTSKMQEWVEKLELMNYIRTVRFILQLRMEQCTGTTTLILESRLGSGATSHRQACRNVMKKIRFSLVCNLKTTLVWGTNNMQVWWQNRLSYPILKLRQGVHFLPVSASFHWMLHFSFYCACCFTQFQTWKYSVIFSCNKYWLRILVLMCVNETSQFHSFGTSTILLILFILYFFVIPFIELILNLSNIMIRLWIFSVPSVMGSRNLSFWVIPVHIRSFKYIFPIILFLV